MLASIEREGGLLTVLYTFVMALSGNSMPNVCYQQLLLASHVSTCSHEKYRFIFFTKSVHHAGFAIFNLTRNHEKQNIIDISFRPKSSKIPRLTVWRMEEEDAAKKREMICGENEE